jgi:hypothetical protein
VFIFPLFPRLLESAVKGGTYYFHLLLKEEEEA